MNASGLVLAGGDSRRMGRDKAMLAFEGELLVTRAVRLLSCFCGEVLVASGDGHRFDGLGFTQVADPSPGTGPLAGMVAGIEAACHPLIAVLAVDMPRAHAGIFRLLYDLWEGEEGVVPELDGKLEPLHALYSRTAAPSLRSSIEAGQRSVRRAVSALRLRVVDRAAWGAIDPEGTFAKNVNSPADLGT